MNGDVPSIHGAAQSMRRGQLWPIQLVERCLEAIACHEPRIHAWVTVYGDSARAAAEQLGREADANAWRGPLHGIPIGVKDIIDVAGQPTRAGAPLRSGHRADQDAEVVSRFRRAGAILLGKTVTTQFACMDPAETCNPLDPTRTPGGSSSGSAAAVATGMCLAALGTQTGGSIIRPATYCGVAGLKPTLGAWSTKGVVPVSFHLDHVGPIARSIADLAMIWHGVGGKGDNVEEDASAEQTYVPPTLVMPDAFFDQRWEGPMVPIVNSAIARLVVAGADVQQTQMPDDFDRILTMHHRIMAAESAEFHRQAYQDQPDAFAPKLAGLIQEGLDLSAVDYAEALKHRQAFIRMMRDRLRPSTFWLTPAATSDAPERDTTGDPAMNAPWSYCGFPAVSVPCGSTARQLPVALQLIGRPGTETDLLQAALWCETVLRG